ESLGRLYERGAEIDWEGFDKGYGRERVALPTYPFQRQRYWIDVKRPHGASATQTHTLGSRLSGHDVSGREGASSGNRANGALFDLEWQEAPSAGGPNALTGDWLIVADRSGIGTRLAAQLSATGARCTTLETEDKAAWQSTFPSHSWQGIVYLGALDTLATNQLTEGTPSSRLRPACEGLLDLVQRLAAKQDDQPPKLWLVTRGAAVTSPEQQTIEVLQAPIWGMAQAIREEHPEWNCSCVDLDPADSSAAVDSLAEEIRAGEVEDEIALRGEKRFVFRLRARTSDRVSDSSTPERPAIEIANDGTYLIAGHGRLGLYLAHWLVERGARSLVLVGRSEPSSPAQEFLQWAKSQGVDARAERADISRTEDVKRVLSRMSNAMLPLRGIVHTAAVLEDGVLTQQSWERFEHVLAPKVDGAWALHELTADLPLDFFVLFSSAASVLGAPGQANYAAANAFEDALAHYRRQLGKPAISINWGAWEGGLLTGERISERQAGIGLQAMSADEGLTLLQAVLIDNPAQICAGFFDWSRFLCRYPQNAVPRRFSGLLETERNGEGRKPAEPELLTRLHNAPESDRVQILREAIHEIAVRVLGFSAGRRLDVEQPLNELGLDSLMSLEFRNALGAAIGKFLPATLLFNYPAIEQVTRYAAGLLFRDSAAGGDPPLSDEARDVLGDIEELSDEEVERRLAIDRKGA
ncbi:MAG: SDR family NAD(P)-dependent oxidoreductase, partial [Candidatus Acidiferrales bacterium]